MGRRRESAWKPSWCYWTCQCAPPTPHTNVQIRASWSWWGGADGKFSSNSLCLYSQFSWKWWCLWYISVVSRVHNLLLSSWKFPLRKSQIHSCEFIQQCLVRQLIAVSDISIFICLINIIQKQIQRTTEWEASRLVYSQTQARIVSHCGASHNPKSCSHNDSNLV